MDNNSALFDKLNQEEVEILFSKSKKQNLPPKTVFIEQGQNSDTAYFIVDGTVNVYRMDEDGNEISVAILGKRDVVGEMAVIDSKPRATYVKTLKDTTVLSLSGADFKEILQKHSEIALHLLSILSQRLRDTDQQLEDLHGKPLADRTWNTLKVLNSYFNNNQIALTHEELASIIGATRARVTETLDSLESEGKILLSPKKITLL